MTDQEFDLIKERHKMLAANGIARPIPMGLPHAKLIEDLGDLIAEKETLTRYINTLVASSVETHRILGTPSGSPMGLAESARRAMKKLSVGAGEPPLK